MRVVFGWEGRGEKIGRARLFFSLGPAKLYHPKLGRKHKGKRVTHFQTKLPLANTNVQHYAFFPFCLFHEFASCSHLFLPSFYYCHYFLFCAHQFLLILVLGHCPFFLRDTAVILFFFSSSFSFFFKYSDFFSIHDFYF